jgi:type IV fimbrial biogenesis protein FimT
MRKTQHGFTLPELLAAMACVAILVGIAIPTMRQFSASSKATAATNSLVTALATARMEALRRSIPVSVCASTNSKTCATSNTWSTGWIVFTDGSGTKGQVDGADIVLQAWDAPGFSMTVNSSTKYIRYDARGMAWVGPGPDYTFPVTFNTWSAGCKGKNQTQVAVTVGGSPQSTRIDCP